jgi:hypothetical protein
MLYVCMHVGRVYLARFFCMQICISGANYLTLTVLCMYVCMHVCVCVCIYIYICRHVYIHLLQTFPQSGAKISIYKACCMYVYTNTHTYIHKQILPAYHDYIKSNPHSLLCRYLGMYRIKPRRCYLLVTMNVQSSTREMHKVCVNV